MRLNEAIFNIQDDNAINSQLAGRRWSDLMRYHIR